jgi:hypothetical protein
MSTNPWQEGDSMTLVKDIECSKARRTGAAKLS